MLRWGWVMRNGGVGVVWWLGYAKRGPLRPLRFYYTKGAVRMVLDLSYGKQTCWRCLTAQLRETRVFDWIRVSLNAR